MNQFVISLGSNSPDRDDRIQRALQMLESTFPGTRASDTYSSPALSGPGTPEYLNAVVVGHTALPVDDLRAMMKQYERASGRTDKEAGDDAPSVVPIDLDVVMYGGRILRPDDFSKMYFNTGYRQLLADGAFQEKTPD